MRFLEAGDYDNGKLYALVVMHMAFVVSALMLTYIDKIGSDKKATLALAENPNGYIMGSGYQLPASPVPRAAAGWPGNDGSRRRPVRRSSAAPG